LYKIGIKEVIIELEEKGLKLVNEWSTNRWIIIKRPINKAKVKWIIKKRLSTWSKLHQIKFEIIKPKFI